MAQEKKWMLRALYHDSNNVLDLLVVSADAAKREAKELKKWALTENISFKIFDPWGSLYQYADTSGVRLRWVWSK